MDRYAQVVICIPGNYTDGMVNNTLFISDCHLQSATPQIAKLFLRFLSEEASEADALYILGDLFEAWIGDDDLDTFNQTIIDAIQQTSTTTPVYIMCGNRDFLMSEKFFHACNARLLDDPCKINCYGRDILLTHGDMLCTQDKRHMRFRNFYHNKKYNQWFLKLPLIVRKYIANKIRHSSKKYMRTAPSYIMDVTPDAVSSLLQRFNINFMIHGHTHRPNIHKHKQQGKESIRIVLDAWHSRGNYFYIDAAGNYELRWFGS